MFGLDPLYTPERQVTGTEVAVFDTNKGIIKVQLDGKGAPIHVANFCELAESGFYDNTKFHRLVPGFVVQGGDPNTREMSVEDVVFGNPGPDGIPGTGGPGYRIKEEFGSLSGSKLCRFAVLFLPWSTAWLGFWVHRIRHNYRRNGCHFPVKDWRCHQFH